MDRVFFIECCCACTFFAIESFFNFYFLFHTFWKSLLCNKQKKHQFCISDVMLQALYLLCKADGPFSRWLNVLAKSIYWFAYWVELASLCDTERSYWKSHERSSFFLGWVNTLTHILRWASFVVRYIVNLENTYLEKNWKQLADLSNYTDVDNLYAKHYWIIHVQHVPFVCQGYYAYTNNNNE